jgi:hypothetical protein
LQTVGAGLGAFGAVPPHSFVDQGVRGLGEIPTTNSARFSDKFVGWVPSDSSSLKVARWELKPHLAAARSPSFDLESLLASHDASFRANPADPTQTKTATAHRRSNTFGSHLNPFLAHFASEFVAATSHQLSADIRSVPEKVLEPEVLAVFRKQAKAAQSLMSKTDARREYVMQQIEALRLENYLYEKVLQTSVQPAGLEKNAMQVQTVDVNNLPPALSHAVQYPALQINALSAAGVRLTDISESAKTSNLSNATFQEFLLARAAATATEKCDPLLYSGTVDLLTAANMRVTTQKPSLLSALWARKGDSALAEDDERVNREMQVFAARAGWWPVAADMAARTREVPSTSDAVGDLPPAPELLLPVRSMADVLRGWSFRMRTLERYRADLEPHRWGVDFNTMFEYSVANDEFADMTPLGRGIAIQPEVVSGFPPLKKCRSPMPSQDAASPLESSDEQNEGTHHIDEETLTFPILHNPLAIGTAGNIHRIDKTADLVQLCSMCSAGGLFQSGQRHNWCGLMGWVRANFATESDDIAAILTGSSGQLKRRSVSFPVRVLITNLTDINAPVYGQPELLWNSALSVKLSVSPFTRIGRLHKCDLLMKTPNVDLYSLVNHLTIVCVLAVRGWPFRSSEI